MCFNRNIQIKSQVIVKIKTDFNYNMHLETRVYYFKPHF
jgi:hypothetical protein